MRSTGIPLLAAVSLLAVPASTFASFHEWRIDEVFSDPTGKVQFVEMFDGFNGEYFTGGLTLTSAAGTFTFPNLSTSSTANHHLLLGTTGYQAIGGAPPVDFDLGAGPFFNPAGDTLTYAGGIDTLSFTSDDLPTDSVHSLTRAYNAFGENPLLTAVNSPTNFAGTSATIALPEPSLAAVSLTCLLAVSCRRIRRRAQSSLDVG